MSKGGVMKGTKMVNIMHRCRCHYQHCTLKHLEPGEQAVSRATNNHLSHAVYHLACWPLEVALRRKLEIKVK
jgi:hypothetical protein